MPSNGSQGFKSGDKPDCEDYSQPIKSPTELHDAGKDGKIIHTTTLFNTFSL